MILAYVDPGTGLFVLQGIISVVVGGVFLARQGIRNVIGAVFRRKREETPADADEPADEAADGSNQH